MSDLRPNRAPMRISPTPFKSSLLSIPPSPFSPRPPLTPVASLLRSSSSSSSLSSPYTSSYSCSPPPTTTTRYVPAPPANPLSWQWTCHQCAHSYPLSAIRRCLDDGHRFCSGTTTVKAWRKPSGGRRVKKHRACASEFDYSGWKTWIRWRRVLREDYVLRNRSTPPKQKVVRRKDCWNNCSYPSECRWGKRYGVHTPIESVFPSTDLAAMSTTYSSPSAQGADSMSTLNRSMENILTPTPLEPPNKPTATTSQTRKDTRFWTSLLASAERRKSGNTHIASPLSVVIEEAQASPPNSPPQRSHSTSLRKHKDKDGDTIMTTVMSSIDPALLAPKPSLTITPTPNMSFMRSSSSSASQPPLESRASPIMLRALWTRNKKIVSSPLRYRRRNSISISVSRVKSARASGGSMIPDAGRGKRRGLLEEDVSEVEEFGVPLVRVGSRDSGYGSCV